MLTTVVVGASIALAACSAGDDRGGASERERGGGASTTPTTTEAPVAPAGAPELVRLDTASSGIGAGSTSVAAIGELTLGSAATLAAATAAFGEPDDSGPTDDDPDVCGAAWGELGVEARFYFGHPASPEASCTRGPLAVAVLADARWRTAPAELGIGDPVERIASSFPTAREVDLPPGLVDLAGAERAWLLAEGSYGGDPFPTLYATAADDEVAALVFVSGAD